MQNEGNRDESVDRLLRQTLAAPLDSDIAPGACVDGETVAAWSGGALSSSDAALVEMHVSRCARCQALFATFARATPAYPAARPLWQRWRMQWLVPIAATATAMAIWIAIPADERPGAVPQAEVRSEAPAESLPPAPPGAASPEFRAAMKQADRDSERAAPAATEQADQDSRRASALAAAQPSPPPGALREEANRPSSPDAANQVAESVARLDAAPTAPSRDTRDRDPRAPQDGVVLPAAQPSRDAREQDLRAPGDQAAAAARAPAQVTDAVGSQAGRAAASPLTGQRALALQRRDEAATEVVSPNSANRWRVLGNTRVERSTTGGGTWEAAVIDRPTTLTAGSSPSPVVCWLVGPAGAVRVTADGLRFQSVPFPEIVDLVGVRATSVTSAVVTTADGRQFRTEDRGRTWNQVAP